MTVFFPVALLARCECVREQTFYVCKTCSVSMNSECVRVCVYMKWKNSNFFCLLILWVKLVSMWTQIDCISFICFINILEMEYFKLNLINGIHRVGIIVFIDDIASSRHTHCLE